MARRRSEKRLGILSDVHGDLRSLRDALACLARLDCDAVVCAGDLLDWGPSPAQTIALLHENRIPCVRGNHDFVDEEGRAADGRILPEQAVAFIDALPKTWRRTIAGVRVAVWHARPGDLWRGVHVDAVDAEDLLHAAGADVLVVGHTHVPMRIEAGRGTIVNPGSVLRAAAVAELAPPASGTFGVLELPSRRFSVRSVTDGANVPTGL